jgi:hypothetical protein
MRINDTGYGQEQSGGVNGQPRGDKITNWTENHGEQGALIAGDRMALSVIKRESNQLSDYKRNFLNLAIMCFLTFSKCIVGFILWSGIH